MGSRRIISAFDFSGELCPFSHLSVVVLSYLLLLINYLHIKDIIAYLTLSKSIVFTENFFLVYLHHFFIHTIFFSKKNSNLTNIFFVIFSIPSKFRKSALR